MRWALLLLLIAGCANPDQIVRYHSIEVKVPVPIKIKPPATLSTPPSIDIPEFVSPSNPAASSALTKEGEQKLKRLLLILHNRDKAWRAWGG